jgi:integrase
VAFVRRRGKRFYIRYIDETGEPVERVTRARTKTEAAQYANDLERRAERIRLGFEHEVRPITVADAYEKHFKPVVKNRGGFPAMDSRFRKHILTSDLAKKLCHMVRPADVEALLAEKLSDGLEPSTVEHIRIELSSLFTFVISKMKAFRGEHPVRAVQRIRIPEKPPKFLELEEIAALFRQVPGRWRVFVVTDVYTGLRFSELRRLRKDEVDLARRALTVWNTKTSKVRMVPIPEELAPYLEHQLQVSPGPWLFTRPKGGQLTQYCGARLMLKRALRRAGILDGYEHICRTRGEGKGCGNKERLETKERTPCPDCGRLREVVGIPKRFSVKDLRSTYATHLTEYTGDLRVTQRALGHGSVTVTEGRYAFARDRHFREQLSGLSLLARSLPAGKTELPQTAPNRAEVVWLERAAQPIESQQETDKPNSGGGE